MYKNPSKNRKRNKYSLIFHIIFVYHHGCSAAGDETGLPRGPRIIVWCIHGTFTWIQQQSLWKNSQKTFNNSCWFFKKIIFFKCYIYIYVFVYNCFPIYSFTILTTVKCCSRNGIKQKQPRQLYFNWVYKRMDKSVKCPALFFSYFSSNGDFNFLDILFFHAHKIFYDSTQWYLAL